MHAEEQIIMLFRNELLFLAIISLCSRDSEGEEQKCSKK